MHSGPSSNRSSEILIFSCGEGSRVITESDSTVPTSTIVRLVGLILLIGVAGCSLGRGAPPPQHFVLGGEAALDGTRIERADLGEVSVGLRRLQIASYLETPFIVVRRGDQELTFSEFNRWGESLDAGISRAVAGYLNQLATFETVNIAPWPARTEHDYLIELSILRFEGVAPIQGVASGGSAHLRAEWQILRPGEPAVLSRGTTELRSDAWEVGDYHELVGKLNQGLQRLSEDLLGGLLNLEG